MTFPTVPTDPGVTRQVLAENPDMMVVAFRFDDGAEGKLHSHPHVQASYVAAGRFDFTVDGVTCGLQAGDSVIVPSGAEHGCRCTATGTLIDTFTPRRDDFL